MVLQVLGEEEGRQKVDKGRKMQLYFVLPEKNIVVIVTLFELILKICLYLRERERDLNRLRWLLFIRYLKSGQTTSLAAFTSASGGPHYIDRIYEVAILVRNFAILRCLPPQPLTEFLKNCLGQFTRFTLQSQNSN